MSSKQSPSQAQLDRYAEAFTNSDTLKNFGVKLSFPDTATALVTLDPIQPQHRGGLGSDAVNGGILAALFDLAIGCTPALVDPTCRTATVELSMRFMRAVRGDKLTARAKVDRAGEVLCFSSASIFDEQGVECASCSGIARLSNIKWSNGDSPAIN